MNEAQEAARDTLNTPFEAARWWTRRGFYVNPVQYRTKKATTDDWPSLRLEGSDLARHFNGRRMNIGIILGVNGAADVDCDCPEAIAAAPFLLP
jgi:hypothetical protein